MAKHLSKELCLKLKAPANKDELSKESLYTVADMLAKMYNPMHSAGAVKNKSLNGCKFSKKV